MTDYQVQDKKRLQSTTEVFFLGRLGFEQAPLYYQ